MPHDPEKSSVLDRLQAIRDTFGSDSTMVKEDQQALLASLTSQLSVPTRVVIAGPERSEHGMLAEFILGADLFGATSHIDHCPPIRVRYGREEKTLAIAGATRTRYPGCNIEAATATDGVAMIDLELPHPILTKLSFLIYPSYNGDERRTHQLFQLIKTSDVIVWCSNAATPWGSDEVRIWKNVPDRQKDHGILALTGADFVISEEETQVFEDKCAAAAGQFESIVSVSVDSARDAAPDGTVIDENGFKTSGGCNLLKEIMETAAAHEADLMDQAHELLADLDQVQEEHARLKQGAEKRVGKSDIELLVLDEDEDDEDDDFEFLLDRPTRADVEDTLRRSVLTCKENLDAAATDGYAPLFQEMVELLHGLRGFLRSGLKLNAEHHQVAIQIDEAEELVGLLSYECDEKSAYDAVDIVRQVSIDFWSRVPEDDEDASEFTDFSDDADLQAGAA